ncbi:agmatinase family protein [Peribacillus sp. NPDC097675]|uniref:agmatinase family protein n=1 Tax=Peribacillus sp. NPDC097675 TaxID=3390618 RepID=UPI003CFCD334
MNDLHLQPATFTWRKEMPLADHPAKVHQWIRTINELKSVEEREKPDCVFFGAPLSRSSISPSGASEFPEYFRRSWKGFSTYNMDYDLDFSGMQVWDIGDIAMHGTDINLCHRFIRETSNAVHNHFRDSLIGGIGGDHSTTAMLVKGMKEIYPDKKIGILQFDTHFDLRDPSEQGPSNGTPMRQLIEAGTVEGKHIHNIGLHGFYNTKELCDYAKKKGVRYVPLRLARKYGLEQVVSEILNTLENEVDMIYVTIDMDVLDMTYAPGVPAATSGGMRPEELLEAVFLAGSHKKVKAFDIVCLDPLRDTIRQTTVQIGTSVFLTMICGLLSRGNNNDSG